MSIKWSSCKQDTFKNKLWLWHVWLRGLFLFPLWHQMVLIVLFSFPCALISVKTFTWIFYLNTHHQKCLWQQRRSSIWNVPPSSSGSEEKSTCNYCGGIRLNLSRQRYLRVWAKSSWSPLNPTEHTETLLILAVMHWQALLTHLSYGMI